MVADLHLGREMSLQKAGVAIPQGASARTIEKLTAQMQHYQAANLLILGDLIHARCSWTDELNGMFLNFCESVTGRCQLIEGNHDRGSRKQLTQFPLEVLQPPVFQNPFWLLHDSDREFPLIERDRGLSNEGQKVHGKRKQNEAARSSVPDQQHPTANPIANPIANSIANSISNPIALAGHLHPGFRLPHTREQVKCFYRKGDVLTLPSFGELTGSRRIHPLKTDQLFLLAGSSVVPWQGN